MNSNKSSKNNTESGIGDIALRAALALQLAQPLIYVQPAWHHSLGQGRRSNKLSSGATDSNHKSSGF